VNRPRAADDFPTIRARLEELRREREVAQAAEGELKSDPHRARNAVILPPVNRFTCCKAKLLFVPKCGAAPPSCPASVWVKVGAWSITAKGGPVQSPSPKV